MLPNLLMNDHDMFVQANPKKSVQIWVDDIMMIVRYSSTEKLILCVHGVKELTQVTKFSGPEGCDISTGLLPVSSSSKTTP